MSTKSFGIFGHGSFGSVWSSDIEDNPNSRLNFVVDTDPIDGDEVPGDPIIKQEDYTDAVGVLP